MRTRYFVAAGAVLVLAAGFLVAAGKGKPAPAEVNLSLTAESQDSWGNAVKVTGDSQGNTYVNGAQGVCAKFDSAGHLIVQLSCASTSTPRNLVFKMNEPLAPLVISTPLGSAPPQDSSTAGIAYVSAVTTVGPHDYPAQGDYVRIQDLAIGQSECLQVNMSYTYANRDKTQFRLAYHRVTSNPAYEDITHTPYGVVTRVTATTWTLEPYSLATCNTQPGITSYSGTRAAPAIVTTPTRGARDFQDAGTWVAPFKFTLTAQ